jgi:hypothetical protein
MLIDCVTRRSRTGFLVWINSCCSKVDADHASDSLTRRSRTGFLLWINSFLVYFLSKKQTSVETSFFGSEFVAMKQCCEYLRGLRYKGIALNGPCYISGDNQSVLANTTEPGSTLKKKSQSIAYHFVREGVAKDEWRTSYVNTHENEADLLTKLLPAGGEISSTISTGNEVWMVLCELCLSHLSVGVFS